MTESCRLITTEQYQEYLKLKEEHKPLSWEEFCEKAKEIGAETYKGREDCIVFHGWLYFCKNKYILIENDGGLIEQEIVEYDQMLAIMKALQ